MHQYWTRIYKGGWEGRSKTIQMAEFRVAMTFTCTNISLQGPEICVLTVEEYQVYTAILEPFIVAIPPVMILLGWQKVYWKSRTVDHA